MRLQGLGMRPKGEVKVDSVFLQVVGAVWLLVWVMEVAQGGGAGCLQGRGAGCRRVTCRGVREGGLVTWASKAFF